MAFRQYIQTVPGQKGNDILLFALSTCAWCRKTKELLRELGVRYQFIDVDLLDDNVREEVVEEIKRWNPGASFPTIRINNSESINGFQEELIRKAVKNGLQ